MSSLANPFRRRSLTICDACPTVVAMQNAAFAMTSLARRLLRLDQPVLDVADAGHALREAHDRDAVIRAVDRPAQRDDAVGGRHLHLPGSLRDGVVGRDAAA